jgi:gluconate 2-dehydrogenase gamma chain
MLNRRDAIRGGLALTVGVAATGWAGARGGRPGALTWTPTALTPDQASVLDVVAELIIPATDTPGAREAGVPQFIDRAVGQLLRQGSGGAAAGRTGPHGRRRPRRSWRRLRRPDAAAAGRAFDGLRPRGRLRTQTASQKNHFFPVLEDMVTVGYFTSEPGATVALQYDPVPGAYHGCVPLAEIGRAWATR